MASISSRNLVDAVQRVERMTFKDRERLAEEVHARQPNLFFSPGRPGARAAGA